jgi:hypothetical protein
LIITLNEVKTILQDSTLSDSLINMFIPLVEADICKYCNNHFIDEEFDFISSGDVSFLSTDNSINLNDIGTKKLVPNDSIRIFSSFRNNGTFTIDSISNNKLIVNSIDTIKDELSSENNTVYITKIRYPIPLKFIAAKLINWQLKSNNSDFTIGVKSEKIDDYQITFEESINGYPSSFMTPLQQYRCLFLKSLFNDCKVII